MKIFKCSACGQTLFFENVVCTKCGHTLAYLPDRRVVSALELVEDEDAPQHYRALLEGDEERLYRLCENSTQYGVCNWAIEAGDEHALCRACRLNSIIPNLSEPAAKDAWMRLEREKRHLLYSLDELGLLGTPDDEQDAESAPRLSFSFMGDDPTQHIVTGHQAGHITINIAEADDAARERIRKELGEPYRTVLGHFRHESGHYYWERLIKDSDLHEPFRAMFGDETLDYAAASRNYYAQGAPSDWWSSFVSAYASMHPWEDWAETWAHYLHMVDTLETARSFGLVIRPQPVGGTPARPLAARSVQFEAFDQLIKAWVGLTVALNTLNRSMGLPDVYPFVLSERAIEKLRFVHDTIERRVRA
ncbi:MAG: putative zinc-binding peptidase [Myxococcales bacterium]